MAKVYARIDGRNLVTAIDSDTISSFPKDGWVLVDEGDGDKYALAASHYLPNLMADMTIPRYRWDGTQVVERTPEEIEADRLPDAETVRGQKVAAVDAACEATIDHGVEVETSFGKKRFTLDSYDQKNLLGIQAQLLAGTSTRFLYRAAGENEHKMWYTAADMAEIVRVGFTYINYNLLLQDFYYQWIARAEGEELDGIAWGVPLPDDLQDAMNGLLAQATDA